MRFAVVAILLLLSEQLHAQYFIKGSIIGADSALKQAEIMLRRADTIKWQGTSTKGNFEINGLAAGIYELSISVHGYEDHIDIITVSKDTDLGPVTLLPQGHMLNEVSVVQKVLAMVQKDDTLEFNSGAYKVNPDADAADLVRKMPDLAIYLPGIRRKHVGLCHRSRRAAACLVKKIAQAHICFLPPFIVVIDTYCCGLCDPGANAAADRTCIG